MLVRAFEDSDPDGAFRATREAFLKTHEILVIKKGGFGVTFVARERSSQKLHRFKFLHRPDEGGKLKRESDKAILAGRIGIGPHADYLAEAGLLRMDEVEGQTLRDYLKTFDKLSEKDQERFVTNFTRALAAHLRGLHEEGIAHLDLKPNNILLPKDHDLGRNIQLIDFGLSLDRDEQKAVRTDEDDRTPWPGTPSFQGQLAYARKPQPADDLESLRLLIENFFPGKDHEKNLLPNRDPTGGLTRPRPLAKRDRMPVYFKARPKLRALLLLFENPVSDDPFVKDDPASPDKLLNLALEPKLPAAVEKDFWPLFLREFRKRSSGQRFQILFSDPVLHSRGGLISYLSKDELRTILRDGVAENEPAYQRATHANLEPPPAENPTHFLLADQPLKVYGPAPHDIDWVRVKRIRDWLAAPPRTLFGIPLPNGVPR